MPQKHTFQASKGDGGFTHARRPGRKGDSGFSPATPCTKKQAMHQVAHHCGDEPLPRNLARNSIGQSFNKVRKRYNSNDLNSEFERVTGELRAKLGVDSAAMCARGEHEACGAKAGPGVETTRRATHQRPGATGVEGTGGPGGPGRGAGGRRRGLVGSCPAPPDWRPPRGLQGLAAVPVGGGGAWPGFETTRRAKLAARTTRGRAAAHRHTQRPDPKVEQRTPATPAAPQATQHRGAGPQARAPSATTQTRTIRSTCVRSRSARAARQSRRSSRSPRLRRRAGPRR